MEPGRVISFKEYLEILELGPNDLRIFLWNILKSHPNCGRTFPFDHHGRFLWMNCLLCFSAVRGFKVALHYDIDMSHVFLNQVHGRKRVLLFAPDQSRNLYRHPFTVASYVDLNNPDYAKYPALAKAKGYELYSTRRTLFTPSGYWHYIEYTDGGYSLSLRSFGSVPARLRGIAIFAAHFVVDKGMNRSTVRSRRK